MGESKRFRQGMTEHRLPERLAEILEFGRSHVLADTVLCADFEELYGEIVRRADSGGGAITYEEAVELLSLDPDLRQGWGLPPLRTLLVDDVETPLGVPFFPFVQSSKDFFVLWLAHRVYLAALFMRTRVREEGDVNSQLASYCARTASEPLVWEALKQAVQRLRDNHMPLPDVLEDWAFAVFSERCPRPGRRGRKAFPNAVRNAGIVVAIRRLVALGMQPTRNEVSAPISACDAVAKVLSGREAPIEYWAVAKIWGKSERQSGRPIGQK